MATNSEPLPGLDALKTQTTMPGALAALQQIFRFLWDKIIALQTLIKKPNEGTLSPDQKPTGLGVRDAGVTFFSTDFNRLYRWNGSAWEDAPTAPARFQVSVFAQNQTPEPSVGWALCNGGSVTRSTSSGNTSFYTTPVIAPDSINQSSWVRL